MTPNTEKWILAGFWTAVLTSLLFGHWVLAVVGAAAGVIFQERGRFTAQALRRGRTTAHRTKGHIEPVPPKVPQPIDPGTENSGAEGALALDVERLRNLVEEERQVETLARGNVAKHQESPSSAILPARSGSALHESNSNVPSSPGAATTIEQWKSMNASEREEFISKRGSLSNFDHGDSVAGAGKSAGTQSETMSDDGDGLTTPPATNSRNESQTSA
jgi:hypothetical protein